MPATLTEPGIPTLAEALELRRQKVIDSSNEGQWAKYAALCHKRALTAKAVTQSELAQIDALCAQLGVQPDVMQTDVEMVRLRAQLSEKLKTCTADCSRLTKQRDEAVKLFELKRAELRDAKDGMLAAESALSALRLDMSRHADIANGRPHLFPSSLDE